MSRRLIVFEQAAKEGQNIRIETKIMHFERRPKVNPHEKIFIDNKNLTTNRVKAKSFT